MLDRFSLTNMNGIKAAFRDIRESLEKEPEKEEPENEEDPEINAIVPVLDEDTFNNLNVVTEIIRAHKMMNKLIDKQMLDILKEEYKYEGLKD